MKLFKFIFSILFIFHFSICKAQENKLEIKNFIYQDDNQKVSIEILNVNKKYLEVNKTTKIKFELENIDKNTVTVSGKTIKILFNENINSNEIIFEISPKIEDLKEGINLFFGYKKDGKFKNFKLNIPIDVESNEGKF